MNFSLERLALEGIRATIHDNWAYYYGRENNRHDFKKINLSDGKIVNLNAIQKLMLCFA